MLNYGEGKGTFLPKTPTGLLVVIVCLCKTASVQKYRFFDAVCPQPPAVFLYLFHANKRSCLLLRPSFDTQPLSESVQSGRERGMYCRLAHYSHVTPRNICDCRKDDNSFFCC